MIEYANNKYSRRARPRSFGSFPAPTPTKHSDSTPHSVVVSQLVRDTKGESRGRQAPSGELRGREAASYLIDLQRSCRFTWVAILVYNGIRYDAPTRIKYIQTFVHQI